MNWKESNRNLIGSWFRVGNEVVQIKSEGHLKNIKVLFEHYNLEFFDSPQELIEVGDLVRLKGFKFLQEVLCLDNEGVTLHGWDKKWPVSHIEEIYGSSSKNGIYIRIWNEKENVLC